MWAEPRLEEILELADPGVWGPEDEVGGINVLRSTNFSNDGRLDLTKLALRAIPQKKRDRKRLQPGDIVLERSGGSPRQPVGRVGYFGGDDRPHSFGNFCQRLRPNAAIVEPRFLFWYLHRFHTAGGTLAFQKQTTGIRNLEYKSYLQQVVPLPPLSEQRRIVEILDQADHLRRLRTEANTKADRILPALFLKMFGDPATNPMGWARMPLAEVTTEMKYGTSSRCDSRGSGVPVLRIPNVVSGSIELGDLKFARLDEKELEKLRLRSGDLLFVRTNGNPTYVGRCAVFDVPGEYAFASYLIRARLNPRQIHPGFASAFLSTPMGRTALAPFIRTTAGQSNISTAGLKQVTVPVPPIELQREFVDQVAKMRRSTVASCVSGDRLDVLFRALLGRAFSADLTAEWRRAHTDLLRKEQVAQSKALHEAGWESC